MRYNFDEIIDRKNTNSLKYDFAAQRGMPENILPLWVADMDFQAPKEVADALVKASSHAIFGYSDVKDDYFDVVKNWFSQRLGYNIESEWLVKTPGVVYAIATAIRALTEKGDAIMIQRPVYYPFSSLVEINERKLINNPLLYKNGKYSVNFDDFERKIRKNTVKMFILCSPHNPVGRVWSKDELTKIGEICLKYNCIVVSDEIHCDFVNDGFNHHVFASINDKFSKNSIICTAPSKTFNLAGLQISNTFIADEEKRDKFKKEMRKSGYSQLNTMGLVAGKAAYEFGGDWLYQLQAYLEGNLLFLRIFLAKELPKIKLVEPEGTYLVWLDCSRLKMNQEQLDDLIINKAGLWLDSGTMFGAEGKGFQRVNIACPRAVLKQALWQLKDACESNKKLRR